jgi:hypothetical protein
MPGAIDNTVKCLTELSPEDWVVQGGWPAARATLIDADIATITGASDKVIHVDGSPAWLLAVDFQAGHDTLAKLPNLLLYNSALFKRHRLAVRSLLVVLHRGADSPQLTGLYERGFPNEPFDVALRYHIIRAWQVPPEKWLSGGLGLVPLAPLGDVRPEDLPAVVAQMEQRFAEAATPQLAKELWSAVYILMGLRYETAVIQALFQGVRGMEESVTYQEILRVGTDRGIAQGITEGQIKEAQRLLGLLGRGRFGEPSPEVVAALESIKDLDRLEELTVRLLKAGSWGELLDQSPAQGLSLIDLGRPGAMS